MTHITAIRRVLADPAGHGLIWCVLCRGPVAVIGFFDPIQEVRRRLAIQPEAIIAYCLCGRCHRLPDRDRRVEGYLFAQLAVQ